MSTQRIKDASFVQQHIEKLILAAGVLILGLSIFLFVVLKPFAIEVNRKSYDKPAEAVDVLAREEKQLQNGLQNTRPLPELIAPNFSETFLATLNHDRDLGRRVSGMSDPGATFKAINPDPPMVSRYALAYPPAPKNIEWKSGTDVLDLEFDPRVAAQFFQLWGKEEGDTGDFTMFVAAGEFDVWQWIERLKADPTGDEEIKIPAGIWAQRFGIAGVALLREEQDPVTGQYINRQIVVPMPGQIRIMPGDKAESETALAIAQINQLREAQIELAQPEMPWLTGFDQVAPPGGEGDDAANDLLQVLDEKNLGKAEKEILKLEKKIAELEAQRARQQRPGNPQPGVAPQDGDAPQTTKRDRLGEQIQTLRERISNLRPQAQKEEEKRRRIAEAERLREEERLRRAAAREERDRAQGIADQDPLGLADIPGMELKEGATLRVWAADPSMQPGKIYRYKLLVAAINPLYAVPRLAPDQLEENQHRAALLPTEAEIEAMEWMGPIEVEPRTRFLFTGGREGTEAKIDIYRRHQGELRVQNFDGAPGDTIGTSIKIEDDLGQTEEVDMRVGAVIIDIEKRRDLFSSNSNQTVYALIYMDAEGNIHERIHKIDESSPARKVLQEEIKEGPKKALRPAPDAQPGVPPRTTPGSGGGQSPGYPYPY